MSHLQHLSIHGSPRPMQLLIPSVFIATWRLRQTWVMILVTGGGVLAAIMLVCAVPLYSYVSTTVGLRTVLNSSSSDANIHVHATMREVSAQVATTVTRQVEALTTPLSPYLNTPAMFALRTQGFHLALSPTRNDNDTLALLGYSMQQVASHVTLLQGRLPQLITPNVEVALTPETAHVLNAHTGSTISIQMNFYEYDEVKANDGTLIPMQHFYQQAIQLYVVGLYKVNTANDPFWNGYDVNPVIQHIQGQAASVELSALVSSSTLLHSADALALRTHNDTILGSEISDFYWTYTYATSRISINQLNELITDLQLWQTSLNNVYGGLGNAISISEQSYESHVELSSSTLSTPQRPSVLEQYRTRLGVVRIPTTILLIEAVTLLLLFVGIMTELLIERQVSIIAVLRSRGASQSQLFGAFLVQGICLSLVAFLVGPFLALFVVSFLIMKTPSFREQIALNVIWNHIGNVLLLMRPYAALVVLITLMVLIFSTYRAMKSDILTLRRETARSMRRPIWQRLNLDLFAVVIAITSYGISAYVSNVPPLSIQSQVLVASPLSLIAPIFLLIAAVLVLLRFFPLLLRISANVAARGKGAAAIVALGQIARTPRHSLRLILLLSLTYAFTVFALMFLASQEQRGVDLASYQVGADFSGQLVTTDQVASLSQQTAAFKNIHGVTSATLGYIAEGTVGGNLNPTSIQVTAVDPGTFAHTALWTTQDSTQSLPSLLETLVAQREQALKMHLLPVVVDATTWHQLNLSPMEHFTVQITNPNGSEGSGLLNCIALLEVQHIPTVATSSITPLPTGILADYQSYAALYQQEHNTSLPLNYVWLRTRSDAASLANVRASLSNQSPRVASLLDRRAIVDALHADPLYLSLIGELTLGVTTALLVTFFGTLLSFWLSAWNRLNNFAVLRALGSSLPQIGRVLIWEQSVTYIIALFMGIVLGVLFSATTVPALVFSSIFLSGSPENNSTRSFYALQQFLPVQLVFPATLALVLALLVASCLIIFGITTRIVMQFSLSRVLRLNED